MRPSITPAENTKNIIMPSNGLYHSFIGTELDNALQIYSYDLSDQKQHEIDNLTIDYPSFNSAFNNVNERMLIECGQHLLDVINDEYGFNIKASGFKYHSMTLQNTGDNLSCDIDVTSLPSLAVINDKISGFTDSLIKATSERLASSSGFISFYDSDIKPLLNVPYSQWAEPYIMVLIETLLDDTGYSLGDIEQLYINELATTGGAIEYLYNELSSHDADILSNLLNEGE